MAISKMSNGFYSRSDSFLKTLRKQDLINYIRTIEKNWENALITNDIQYHNCKRLLAEERNKTIDDVFDYLKTQRKGIHMRVDFDDLEIRQYKEQLKADATNENSIIDEFANALKGRLTDAIHQKDVESMTNLINDVAREVKAGGENE